VGTEQKEGMVKIEWKKDLAIFNKMIRFRIICLHIFQQSWWMNKFKIATSEIEC
jgi:hypothetical protein